MHQLATDAAAAELPGVPLVELELGDRCADVGRGAARARHGLHHVAAVRRSVCTTSPPIGRGAALGLAAPRRRSPPRSTSLMSAAARPSSALTSNSARAELRRRRSPPRPNSPASCTSPPPIADLRRALLVTAELSPLDGVRHAATFLACQPDTSRVSLAPHPSGITSQSSPRSAELELQITSRLRRSLPRTRPARPLLPPWPANAG